MSNIVQIKKPPSDLAQYLRTLADKADRGELTDLVACYCDQDHYQFIHGSSLQGCVSMASMLWSECVDKMRR